MRIEVNFEVVLPFAVKREGKWYISGCPILDVYSQGTTQKKAVTNLVEALQVFLLSCFERGALDQVLRDCGFKPAPGARLQPPKRAARKSIETLTVPLPFVVQKRREELCLA